MAKIAGRGLADTVATLAARDAQIASDVDAMWLMVGALFVFFIQVGFALKEAGSVATKNTRLILLKNVAVASVSAIAFWAIGFAIASGDTGGNGVGYGVFGNDHFFLNRADFKVSTDDDAASGDFNTGGAGYALWMFQFAGATLVASIASGAMAERVTVGGCAALTFALAGVIYPVAACVVWNPQGLLSALRHGDGGPKWFGCGALDFAGAGVIHLVGGVAALVGAAMIGPRRALLVNEVEPQEFGPAFQTMGTLMAMCGWAGLNVGAAVLSAPAAATPGGVGSAAAKAVATSVVSAACGALSGVLSLAVARGRDEESGHRFQPRFRDLANSTLSGLVAVSACAAVVEPSGAVAIGLVSGQVYSWAVLKMDDWGTDDVALSAAVHGANGAWGLLAAGLFATPHGYASLLFVDHEKGLHRAESCAGLLYGSGASGMAAQAVGLGCLLAWSGAASFAACLALRGSELLRIDEEEEDAAMDDEAVLLRSASRQPPTPEEDLAADPLAAAASTIAPAAASVNATVKDKRGTRGSLAPGEVNAVAHTPNAGRGRAPAGGRAPKKSVEMTSSF